MDNVAVADFDNLKSAALYFDGVIPAFNRIMLENDSASVSRAEALLTGQFPEGSDVQRVICEEVIRLSDPSVSYDDVMALVPPNAQDQYRNLLATQLALHLAMMIQRSPGPIEDMSDRIDRMAARVIEIQTERLMVGRYPLIRTSGTIWDEAFPPAASGSDAIVTLANLKVIDPAEIPWDHIREIRADKDAMVRLRRLRSFFRETYDERPLEAISDDLHVRLYDYQTEAMKQGLVLTDAVLGAASETKGLLGVAGGILAAAGQPWGLAAVAVELGGIVVKVTRAVFDRRSQMASHPMAYFAQIKSGGNAQPL